MVFTVLFKNIVQNNVTLLPAPVDVKIRGCLSVEVQETFKIQVEFIVFSCLLLLPI